MPNRPHSPGSSLNPKCADCDGCGAPVYLNDAYCSKCQCDDEGTQRYHAMVVLRLQELLDTRPDDKELSDVLRKIVTAYDDVNY